MEVSDGICLVKELVVVEIQEPGVNGMAFEK